MGYFYSLPPVFVGGTQPYAPPPGQVQSGALPPVLSVPPLSYATTYGIVNSLWLYDPPIVITLPSAAGNVAGVPSQPPVQSVQLLSLIVRQWDPPQYFWSSPQTLLAPFLPGPTPPSQPPSFPWAPYESIFISWLPPPVVPPILQYVLPQPQQGPTAPVITTQPLDQTILVGGTATFMVTATGTALTYQWFVNGVLLAGAIAPSFTTPAAALTDNGSRYSCTVSNAGGSVVSYAALLTVVTLQPGQLAMPSLVGLSWYDASFQLVKLGLVQDSVPIQVPQIVYPTYAAGTVVNQAPAAGSIVSPGTNVQLTVIVSGLLSVTFDLNA